MSSQLSLPQINWRSYSALAGLVGLILVLVWAYWNSLDRTAHFWENPKYSHGYLIPVIAAFLLWLRRSESIRVPDQLTYIGASLVGLGLATCWIVQEGTFIKPDEGSALSAALESNRLINPAAGTDASKTLSPEFAERKADRDKYVQTIKTLVPIGQFLGVALGICGAALLIGELPQGKATLPWRWLGVGLLLLAVGVRLLTSYYPSISPELASFVPAIIGLFLIVGGWPTLKWAGPPLLFLIFMFPLPNALDTGLLAPLQKLATYCSRYALQTLGIACYQEGNTIVMGPATPIGVAEQCSGLRMLTMFIAISVAFAMISNRPIWERSLIVLSAIPIALLVNISRITVTGVLYYIADNPNNALGITKEMAENIFHDYAGLVMMPVALGLMYVEYQILSHLVIEELPAGGVPFGLDVRRPRRGPALTK